MSDRRPPREHDRRRMVYLRSMNPVLAALLLLAGSADAQVAAESVPAAGTPPPPAAASDSATPPAPKSDAAAPPAGSTPIPEATAPQVPPKPGVPNDKLEILGKDIRLDAYQQFRALCRGATP